MSDSLGIPNFIIIDIDVLFKLLIQIYIPKRRIRLPE